MDVAPLVNVDAIVAYLDVFHVEWTGRDLLGRDTSHGHGGSLSPSDCTCRDAVPHTRGSGQRPSGPLDPQRPMENPWGRAGFCRWQPRELQQLEFSWFLPA